MHVAVNPLQVIPAAISAAAKVDSLLFYFNTPNRTEPGTKSAQYIHYSLLLYPDDGPTPV